MLSEAEIDRQVRVLLEIAGLDLSEEEIEMYKRIYPRMREGADSLYIPETRYEEPALVFSADW